MIELTRTAFIVNVSNGLNYKSSGQSQTKLSHAMYFARMMQGMFLRLKPKQPKSNLLHTHQISHRLKHQVIANGGPQPQSTIEFAIKDEKIGRISNTGLIDALELGTTTIVGRAVGLDADNTRVVYSQVRVLGA